MDRLDLEEKSRSSGSRETSFKVTNKTHKTEYYKSGNV